MWCPFTKSNFSWQLIPELLIDLYLHYDNDHRLCWKLWVCSNFCGRSRVIACNQQPRSLEKFANEINIQSEEEEKEYYAIMKFSAWPETTLKYSLSKNTTFRLGSLLRAKTDTRSEALKFLHSNILNGLDENCKKGSKCYDKFYSYYTLNILNARNKYQQNSQPLNGRLRISYRHDTGLLLSTCTNVPMFYSCERLKTYSRRLNELKTFRYRRKRKYTPSLDISNRSIRGSNWTRKYKLNFQEAEWSTFDEFENPFDCSESDKKWSFFTGEMCNEVILWLLKIIA